MSDDAKDFPVISETELPPARSRGWGLLPSIRDRDTLPQQRPGTVLVFNDGSRWTQARGRLKGTEDFVVDAVAVSVVRTRERIVDVDLEIHSKDPADDFGVLVRFACRVTNPELVAKELGPVDLSHDLKMYLEEDQELQVRGIRHTVSDIHEVRRLVNARVRAYCDETLPNLPGIAVRLSAVDVMTPVDLKEHMRRMRTERWDEEFKTLTAAHEDGDVRRLAVYLADPASAAAMAMLRDKIDVEKIVTAAYADRRTQDDNLLEILKLLERTGWVDGYAVDTRALFGRLMDRLTGGAPPLRVDATVVPEQRQGDGVVIPALDRAGGSDEERFTIGDDR